MERNFASFIKFGEKQYMEKLLLEGEVFCRPLDYFTKIASNDLRGDKNDGAAYLKQIKDLKVRHKGVTIATAVTGQLYGRNPQLKGNIFCLFALNSDDLNFETKAIKKLHINLDGVSFGDSAVWIFDPGEFMKRLRKAIKRSGLKSQFSPISYYDHESYEGKLTPFDKSNVYSSQNEVRFWIPNNLNEDMVFRLGNISDIAGLIPIDLFDTIEYEPI